MFFFFQAEDGIRDYKVTGVQTCALPIYELREGEVGLFGERNRRVERLFGVARETEDERAEHVDAVAAERAQPRDEFVAGEVEPLVDVVEAVARDRLDADERAENPRALHRVEKLRILGRPHRDLRVEDEILRQRGEARHQREAL